MTPTAFGYLVVLVKDLDSTVQFYTEVLGLEKTDEYEESDGTRVAFVSEKGKEPMTSATMIEFVAHPGYEPQPNGFMVGLVVESIDAILTEAAHRGYEIGAPHSPAPGSVNVEFFGPEGQEISLLQLVPAEPGLATERDA